MNGEIRVGVIGDFDPAADTHRATNDALEHAAGLLSMPLNVEWIATPELECAPVDTTLRGFQALWRAPASPYRSMSGALDGIRDARQSGSPFIGT